MHFPVFPGLPTLIHKVGCGMISWTESRVYSRARLCGISAIRKKMPHEIYVGASNGAHKVPKDKYKFSEIKCSKISHRPECYCLLRHVLTAPDFRTRGIIICMFRTSRLWLVRRPCLWEYLESLRDSTAVNQTVGSVKQISRCEKVNNWALIRPRSLFKPFE